MAKSQKNHSKNERKSRRPETEEATDGKTFEEQAATPAAQSFDELGLSEKVLDAVRELGHTTPTPVQAQAIPLVLEGLDVMAAAQTGTGKTEAFLLPTLSTLGHAAKGRGPLMLVITPTRELARQIDDVAEVICRHTGHRSVTLVGGVGYEPQYEAMSRGCDLLVATPGRLQDLIDSGHVDLGEARVLVLDEADRMLDMGFLPAVRKIVKTMPQKRQTLLFSATLDDDAVSRTKSLVHDPARVTIARKGTAAETVDQYVLAVSPEAKNRVLAEVLRREGSERVIVFCRGKHRADGICRRLRKAGFSCAPIHGNRTQNQREKALARFRDGEVDILVATDVLARGIDVPDVSYVVNFDVPDDAEDYIHRIGRTGRAGERGWALTFVTEDDYLELRDAEALMGKVIPEYTRADGIDLGEHVVEMDPERDPHEKLPGKKARKRMAEERAARRAAEREGAEAGRVTRREPGRRAKGKVSGNKGSGDASRGSDGGSDRNASTGKARSGRDASQNAGQKKRRRKSQRPQSRRRSSGNGSASGARPAGSGRPKVKRHPGDHGGRR